jgi:hypothetical protein
VWKETERDAGAAGPLFGEKNRHQLPPNSGNPSIHSR